MMKKTIQVAGIIDSAEAQMIIESGATHLGFPLRLAIHKEDISEEAAGRIIRTLKPPYFGVLITYLKKADDILNLCRWLGARKVQLHADIT